MSDVFAPEAQSRLCLVYKCGIIMRVVRSKGIKIAFVGAGSEAC